MATKRNFRKTRTNGPARLGKPNGIIQPRVQKVGPQRFGIVVGRKMGTSLIYCGCCQKNQ